MSYLQIGHDAAVGVRSSVHERPLASSCKCPPLPACHERSGLARKRIACSTPCTCTLAATVHDAVGPSRTKSLLRCFGRCCGELSSNCGRIPPLKAKSLRPWFPRLEGQPLHRHFSSRSVAPSLKLPCSVRMCSTDRVISAPLSPPGGPAGGPAQ